MKAINVFISLLIISCIGKAQEVHWIKFIYYGKQLRPHGTLVIAVDTLILPIKKSEYPDSTFGWHINTRKDSSNAHINSRFGLGIQTNQNTLNALVAFIQQGKYTFRKYTRTSDFDVGYEVIDSKGPKYFLPDCNFSPFFRAISAQLQEENLDNAVTMAFKNYNWNWGSWPQLRDDSVPPVLGIPISKAGFDSVVQKLLIRFRSPNDKNTAEDYIDFVRVMDTYGFYWLEDNNRDELFQLYRSNSPELMKLLEASGGGSWLYSKKYDLVIGSGPTKNNFYRIQSSCESSSHSGDKMEY
jgi:hypothetical protein